MKRTLKLLLVLLVLLSTLLCSSCSLLDFLNPTPPSYDGVDSVPPFDGKTAFVILNDGVPYFDPSEYTAECFEEYAELDRLGRCGVTFACVGVEIMPTDKRESISSVKPSGWQSETYEHINGKYLYNRCHLIGHQLTGENANERNLITGTRFLNIDGMLPFENLVADHVKELEHHVLYRVTPIFHDKNLVADGVVMEGYCIECAGEEAVFCIYAYNCQPGVEIDYKTGKGRLSGTPAPEGGDETTGDETTGDEVTVTYIINISSKRFHKPTCAGAVSMKESNRQESTATRDELIAQNYIPCGTCKP